MLSFRFMKTFLVLVLSIVAIFVWQRQSAETVTATKAPAKLSFSRPLSRGRCPSINWAKNSLDRAHEVVEQVQLTREHNDQR